MKNLPARIAVCLAVVCMWVTTAPGQAPMGSERYDGMRPADLRAHAIVDARIVTRPGTVIESGAIFIEDGVIQAVGADIDIPGHARVWSAQGRTVYPGLIDAALMIPPDSRPDGAGAHWNGRVHPQLAMSDQPAPSRALRSQMRKLGFTTAAVYGDAGIFRGSGTVLALADAERDVVTYREKADMAASFDRGGSWGGESYPNSLMGAIALFRQTLYDAAWHAEARRVYAEHPQGHEPPDRADALRALADVIGGEQRVLFDADDERNLLRAAARSAAFDLDLAFVASGREFRRLDDVLAVQAPLIVPVNFPDRPDIAGPAEAEQLTLRTLMTWEQAPTNARRLIDGGATVALTTHRLDGRGRFHRNLHRAIEHGLSADDALAALTMVPAELLGLDHVMGTIEPGKLANLVVVDGELFDRSPDIREVWITGRRHEIESDPTTTFTGEGELAIGERVFSAEVDSQKPRLRITLDDEDETTLTAERIVVQNDRLACIVDGRLLDVEGYVQIAGVIADRTLRGAAFLPDGTQRRMALKLDDEADEEKAEDDEASEEDADDEPDEQEDAPPERLVTPLGAYGFAQRPEQQDVLVEHATIWTAGPAGIIEDGFLLVEDGEIAHVGRDRPARVRDDVLVIDGSGRHVTPGLQDCHSHTGISSGINEWTQVNTAEVRISDVIDPDTVHWYRQLAGGLTLASQLHGSANPIGGQNSVVKLKWSGSAEDMHLDDAPLGIKFALGENVVRRQSRYPNTRMGVETVLRNAFMTAEEYAAEHERYDALPAAERARTMPPRRDLEKDALVDILNGDMAVHCHSYRQDEILMLIRVAEDFGFTIGTFQHVLEGYKVAEAIAEHGAGASSFSDWWGYKVEVQDAIPHNGAVLHETGVLTTFNSDSSELARRMNTEAAKAVRYGNVEPHDALKFVTINVARQLGIDDRTGSLEVGKDGDFVVWSDDPLSTYARCEQTWIEGTRYFDLETDQKLREWNRREHRRLVQKVLADEHGAAGGGEDEDAEDESGEAFDDAGAEPPERSLIARWVHQQRLAYYEQLVREGRDPEQRQPGECGCSDLDWWIMLEQRSAER